MLPQRKKNILKAIVENYISTAEPQGSKSIALELGGVSSATIRHEMSELEDMGFLEKQHISSGRIPSATAFKLYVEELMEMYQETANEVEELQQSLAEKISKLDDISRSASKILSEITNYAGISFSKRIGSPVFSKIQLMPLDNGLSYVLVAITTSSEIKNKIITVEHAISQKDIEDFVTSINELLKERRSPEFFLTISKLMSPLDAIYPLAIKVFDFMCHFEDNGKSDVYVDGTANLLSQPEFRQTDKAIRVLDFLSDGNNLSSLTNTVNDKMVNIKISPNTSVGELSDTAFVFTTYELGDDMQGVLGIVGPLRMDYADVALKLETFAKTLGKYFPVSFEHKTKDITEE